jgi:hypothetical protein
MKNSFPTTTTTAKKIRIKLNEATKFEIFHVAGHVKFSKADGRRQSPDVYGKITSKNKKSTRPSE